MAKTTTMNTGPERTVPDLVQFHPRYRTWLDSPNPAPALYPGGGGGALTQLGNCATFFNQYASSALPD